MGFGLVPCTCLSHPPIIVRPKVDKQLNESIRNLLGIPEECLSFHQTSSYAFQPRCEASLDPTKAVNFDSVIAQAHMPLGHRQIPYNFESPCDAKKHSQSTPNRCTHDDGILGQEDFNDLFPEESFVLSQTNCVVKKEQSQDDFAELWADFGSIPTTIVTESHGRQGSHSNCYSLPLLSDLSQTTIQQQGGDFSFGLQMVTDSKNCLTSARDEQVDNAFQQTFPEVANMNSKELRHVHDGMTSHDYNALFDRSGIETQHELPSKFGFSAASGQNSEISAGLLKQGDDILKNSCTVDMESTAFVDLNPDLYEVNKPHEYAACCALDQFLTEEGKPLTVERADASVTSCFASKEAIVFESQHREQEIQKDMQPQRGFFFATASGKSIDITTEMLQKGEELLKDNASEISQTEESAFKCSFATSLEKKFSVTPDLLQKGIELINANKCDFPAMIESCAEFEFSNAPGKNIDARSDLLQNGVELCKSEISEMNEPIAKFGFAVTPGSKIDDPIRILLKGDEGLNAVHGPTGNTLSENVDSNNLIAANSQAVQESASLTSRCAKFSFSTASGKKIDLTPEMLRKGEELLDAIPDRPVNTTSDIIAECPISALSPTAEFSFATASGKNVDMTPVMLKKGEELLNAPPDPWVNTIPDLSNDQCPVPQGNTSNPTLPTNPPCSSDEAHLCMATKVVIPNSPSIQKEALLDTPRCFVDDLTNAQEKSGNGPVFPKSLRLRKCSSSFKRCRDRLAIRAEFKTPSPITTIERTLADVGLQTPPSQTYRKRLKFTPPVCRRPSVNKLEAPQKRHADSIICTKSLVPSSLQKIGLADFTDKIAELKKGGVICSHHPSNDILCLTSALATSYSFPDGKAWYTAHQDLLASGASASWASEAWVKNHYRWIVWKLASLERRIQVPVLEYDRVFKQLLRRYQKEFTLSRRSCLKVIAEHDCTPTAFMVLCIASINYETKAVELTDGWYSIFAELDAGLKKVLSEKRLAEGLKLRLFNCTLVGDLSPCTPLENSNMRLRLSINCTRRATWNARLGYQQRGPFLISLSSLKPNGGVAPKAYLQILRTMPTQFNEKIIIPNGKPSKFTTRVAIRNKLGEDAACFFHEKQMSILQELLQENLPERTVQCILTHIGSSKSLSTEISKKVAHELHDASFEKVLEILQGKICTRSTTAIHRYLITSARPESNPLSRTYILNVCNTNLQNFQIGDMISAIHFDCSSGPYGSLTLSSTNRSQINIERSMHFVPTELCPLLFSCHDLRMGHFFDALGRVVYQTDCSIVLCSYEQHSELLVVQLGADWQAPNFHVGQAIKIENLFYNRFDSRLNCHSAVGRGTASISTENKTTPLPLHFALQCRRACAFIDPSNHPVLQQLPGTRPISNILIGNVVVQPDSSFGQNFATMTFNATSIVVKKTSLYALLGGQKDITLITGRCLNIWVSAELESHNSLIAEAIEFS